MSCRRSGVCVEVRTLFRRDLDRARHKHHTYRRLASPLEQLLERRVNTRNRLQRGKGLAVRRMNILVLAEIGELLVRLIRERKFALAAVGGAVLVISLDRILLTAVTTADEVALGHRFGLIFLFCHRLSVAKDTATRT